jgi:hypothetical protein
MQVLRGGSCVALPEQTERVSALRRALDMPVEANCRKEESRAPVGNVSWNVAGSLQA